MSISHGFITLTSTYDFILDIIPSTYEFFGPLVVAERVLENMVCLPLSVLPSVHPSFRLSFHPSFCLLVPFLWTVSLTFCKFWHGAWNPYEVVHDRARFSGKIFFAPKIGKMISKWGKQRGFLIYWNIYSLIFTEFDL